MTKRPYILADSVFDSLPPERQAKIMREANEILAEIEAAKKAKKVVGLDIRQPTKTSKRKAK